MDLRKQVVALSQDRTQVTILDQTRLPGDLVFLTPETPEACYDAIKKLQVRGAPAIGVFAAYAMSVLARRIPFDENYFGEYHRISEYLNSSRPTAVNLSWALRRMEKTARLFASPGEEMLDRLTEEALLIDEENLEMTRCIAEAGLSLIHDGDGVLTHCNAGYLACLGYGTATAPVYLAKERGMKLHVYADETRPLLQGARLTTFELAKAGVDVTLLCDNMASLVMKQGKIQAVFVGCDRVAANGDTANKIGTSGVAILAHHYGIPFYVLGPSSTIDMSTPTGDQIVIEERDADEIRSLWYQKPMAPSEVGCFNPAFDVTDHSLISGIVTEKGVIRPPYDVHFSQLFGGNKS